MYLPVLYFYIVALVVFLAKEDRKRRQLMNIISDIANMFMSQVTYPEIMLFMTIK
jgi:hypothetical protein